MKNLTEYLVESIEEALLTKSNIKRAREANKYAVGGDFKNLDEIAKCIEDVFADFANGKYKKELNGKSFDSKAFIGELQRLGFSEKELIEYFNYVNDINDWEDCICPYKFDGDEIELADQLSASIDTNDNN